MEHPISAVILAAGTSSRMGTAKQLLPLAGRPMLEHVITRVLAEGFTEVIAVIGHRAQDIQQAISIEDSRFKWVINEEYGMGQATSFKLAVSSITKHHPAMMVFLGDLPSVSASTIRGVRMKGEAMLAELQEPFVIRPQYGEVAGHPVFFGHINRELFRQVDGDRGAKDLMKEIPVRVSYPTEDTGILQDIDTPEAYEKARKEYAGAKWPGTCWRK